MDNGQLTIDNAMQRDDAQSIVNYLIVPNPLKALQKLAEQHRNRFQIPVIGITGSNGKTVVKEWLHQLLSPNVPLSVLPAVITPRLECLCLCGR